jgi:membrane protease YdiL (CAAX protease family)
MVGDHEPARRDLGVEPRSLSPEHIRGAAARVPSLFGTSLRLVTTDDHARWLRAHAASFPKALAVAAAALLLMPAAGLAVENVWYRMACANALLVALALRAVPLAWKELYRPRAVHLAWGVGSAAALYGAGAVVFNILQHVPGAAAQIAAAFAWRDAVPASLALPLLVAIVAAEEIVWRNAVTLPFAARRGPVAGTLLAAGAFAAAHVSLGVPVLLVAALGAGTVWSALVVRTRSALPALISHLLWDAAVLFLFPYGG